MVAPGSYIFAAGFLKKLGQDAIEGNRDEAR
jgi:hypothetical protein